MKKLLSIGIALVLVIFLISALYTYYTTGSGDKKTTEQGAQSGRWVKSQHITDKNAVSKEDYDRLIGLGYLQGYKSADLKGGVTVYNQEKAFSGINLVLSGHAPEATIMNMKGDILHTWQYKKASEIWPQIREAGKEAGSYWRRAYVYPNGDLLAIYDNIGMIKLDKNSNLQWDFANPNPHHDLDLDENRNIYVLTSKRTEIARLAEGSIQEEFITILSPDGQPIQSYSLIDLIENSPYANLLKRRVVKQGGFYGHILHSNSLEIFDGSLEHKSPLFKKGNVLVSILILDTIAIFDLSKQQLVWALGPGLWKVQHQATLLENGNMLVFDNRDSDNRSQVLEFDPFTQEIAWEYSREKKHEFFSRTCGSNQRLGNGNTLITETDTGRAFEVTPDKKIVWEYINPNRAGEKKDLIAVVPEVVRLNPAEFPFLKDTQ